MHSIRRIARTILVNGIVLLLLLACVAFVPPIIYSLYLQVRTPNAGVFDYSYLPNYKNNPWAKEHFSEYRQLTTQYYDFIGWRRNAFKGKTISVDENGYRKNSYDSPSQIGSSEIWLFGGSTMFGTGSRDSETIPSYLQNALGSKTFNFGETGYTAHQSLNLLMKAYLEGGKPKIVIFYDGVNDVVHKCRKGQSHYSSALELTYRNAIKQDTAAASSVALEVFNPTLKIFRNAINKFRNKFDVANNSPNSKLDLGFDCQDLAEKPRLIAEALVQDWIVAKHLTESNGGRFLPILQPVSYLGKPNLSHLNDVKEDKLSRSQYELVYKELRFILKKRGLKYLDLSGSLDGEEYYYFDFCHISPNGNQVIANDIAKYITKNNLMKINPP